MPYKDRAVRLAYSRENSRRWYANNLEHARAKRRAYRKTLPPGVESANMAAWRAANPERARKTTRDGLRRMRKADPLFDRRHSLKSLYGLTLEQFDAMLSAQGGVCAICRQPPTGSRNCRRLHVDHDHATGKVRSLLCINCNTGVGRFKDSPELLRAAIAYLESHAPARLAL